MKKNKLLPIILLAGAGFAAYMYFKNKGAAKSAAKDITDGIDVSPLDDTEKKESLVDQTTTTSEEAEPVENKIESYIKTGSSILNTTKQIIKGRKKRRSTTTDQPVSRRTTRKAARTAKRTTRKAARTAKRTTRKNKKVLTGFEF